LRARVNRENCLASSATSGVRVEVGAVTDGDTVEGVCTGRGIGSSAVEAELIGCSLRACS
jgi:hypothetical protein